MPRPSIVALAILSIVWADRARADEPPVSYSEAVVPFLEEHCIACHDDGFETSGLALHDVAAMLKGGRRGPALLPGKPAESPLIQYLKGTKQPQMPPKTSIPLDQIAVLERWISQGAKVDQAGPNSNHRELARKLAVEEAAIFASDAPPPVTSLAFRPDGKVLAVAGYKEVVLVDPYTGKTIHRLAGFPEQVSSVAFSNDGKQLAGAGGTPGNGGELRIWDARSWTPARVLRGHSDVILATAWRPHSDQIATASLDRKILIWDAKSGQIVRTLRHHADIVNALAYSPDGKVLASGSADKTAKIFDADSGLQTAGLSTHNDSVLQVAFSPDGQHLATASADKGIAVWKLSDLKNPIRAFGHTGPVYGLAWRPDGSSLWAGSGGRPSFLSYKVENGNRVVDIKEATMPADWVYAVAVSPDNTIVAACGWDGTVSLWGLKDGSKLRSFVPGR
jgi:WD40 repeat protein/cytochrome c551/c552